MHLRRRAAIAARRPVVRVHRQHARATEHLLRRWIPLQRDRGKLAPLLADLIIGLYKHQVKVAEEARVKAEDALREERQRSDARIDAMRKEHQA